MFDRAFKADAVRAVRDGGRTVAAVARELGIARSTLVSWMAQAEDRPEVAAPAGGQESGNGNGRRAPATILDVARHAQLSKSVVSRALANHYGVSEEARRRVQESVRELGYVHNAMAQGLSSQRTFTLGVLVRDASSPIYGHTQSALQMRASQCGYRVITTTGTGTVDLADERSALRDLIALRVEGLIVCSGPLPADDIVASCMGYPVVVAGRLEEDSRLNAVFGDEVDGVEAVAEHLAGLGHRRAAVPMVDPETSAILAARSERFVRALGRRGVDVVPIPCRTVADADAVVTTATTSQCTAVAAPNDRYAGEFLATARDRDISVPGELSVTGFDGIAPYTSSYFHLTTWRQPIPDIGRRAVDRLLELIHATDDEAARHERIPGELVIGRTTAPPA
ncbi:substrate-binding domain-containing protein [Streptomyces tubercidicus]